MDIEPLIPDDRLSESLKQMLQRFNDNVKNVLARSSMRDNQRQVHVGFYRSDDLNGQAYITQKHGQVAFGTACDSLLTVGITSLFAHLDLTPLLNDSSRPFDILTNSFSRLDKQAGVASLITSATESIQADRPALCRWAIREAWQFLLHHELAHLLYGHLGLLRVYNERGKREPLPTPLRSRSTQSEETDDRETMLFYHALEMEADQMAMSVLLGTLLLRHRLVTHQPVDDSDSYAEARRRADDPEVRFIFTRLKTAAIPLFAGVYWIFRLFGMDNRETGRLLDGDHPHPAVRVATCLRAEVNWLKRGADCPSDAVDDLLAVSDIVMFECEHAIARMTGSNSGIASLNEWKEWLGSTDVQSYLAEVLGYLDNLRRQSAPHRWLT